MSIINTSQSAGPSKRVFIEDLPENIINKLSKKIFLPEVDGHICLEIINNCNAKCGFCLAYKDIKHQKSDNIFKIIKILYQYGVKDINISGGEPTLRSDYMDIIQFAYNLGIDISLTSNCYLLDEYQIKRMMKYIKYLCVSLYSHNKEEHDSLTGLDGSYDKIMQTIKICNQINLPVRVHTVVTKVNQKSLDGLLDLLSKNNKVLAWKLMKFSERSSGLINKSKFKITNNEFNNIYKQILQKNNNLNIITSVPQKDIGANCVVNSDGGILVLDGITSYCIGFLLKDTIEGLKSRLKCKYNINLITLK